MKKSHAGMVFGLILILSTPLVFVLMNSSIFSTKSQNSNVNYQLKPLTTKIVTNITLILNYNDGENVTFFDITLIGDISPYNITVYSLGKQNIDEYWAINGVFIKALRINSVWYRNGDNNRYWLYYVNGEFPSISSSVYELENDSIVEWKFIGSPYGNNNNNDKQSDDSWIFLGILLGIICICVVGIVLLARRGI